MPQWFLQHHAHARVVEASGAQLLADDREKVRAGGEVHHHGVCAAAAQPLAQQLVVLGLGQVHAQVMNQGGKAVELVVGGALGVVVSGAELVFQPLAVAGVGALVTGHREDATLCRQLAMAPRLEQRGHEFAPGQIARATEKNQIKGHARDPIKGECGHSRGLRVRLS